MYNRRNVIIRWIVRDLVRTRISESEKVREKKNEGRKVKVFRACEGNSVSARTRERDCESVYICVNILILWNDYITITNGKANTKNTCFLYQICIIVKYYSVFCNLETRKLRLTSECLYVRVISSLYVLKISFCNDPIVDRAELYDQRYLGSFEHFSRVGAKEFRLTPFAVARDAVARFSMFRCARATVRGAVRGCELLPMNVTRQDSRVFD